MSAAKTREEQRRPAQPVGPTPPADTSERLPIFVAVAAIIGLLYLVRAILPPFLFAAIAGYLAAPLLAWAARRTGLPRSLFAALLFVAIVATVAGLALLAAPRIVQQAAAIGTDAEQALENLARQVLGDGPIVVLGTSMDPPHLAHAAIDGLRDWLGQTGRLAMLAGWSFAAIFGGFLTLVLLFYFLAGGPRIASGILWMVPPRHRATAQRIWARLDPVLKRYFVGVAVVVVYATIASYVGLGLILGLHHAVLLACLTGVLEMIPVIGPGAAAVIAGLVALRYATGIWSIVGYATYATALRLSIDQLLGPIVLGRAAHVHPVLVIFCFLAGAVLFGVAGVIMAMPVALAVKHTLAVLYDEPP